MFTIANSVYFCKKLSKNMMNTYADIYVFQWGNEGRAGVPERRIRKRSGRGEEERRRRRRRKRMRRRMRKKRRKRRRRRKRRKRMKRKK